MLSCSLWFSASSFWMGGGRAKNTSIKLPICIKLAFTLFLCGQCWENNTRILLRDKCNRYSKLLVLFYFVKVEEWDGLDMWRMWVRRGECIGSCWGNRREGDHWGDLGVDGWIILGWISRRWNVGIWTGLGWPRIETVGGRLWVR